MPSTQIEFWFSLPCKRCPNRGPDTPSEGGGTWVVTGFRNEVARFARFSQCFPSGQHIWIGYAIVRVWCSRVSCASPWGNLDSMAARVLLGNPDGVAPDSNARSMSSGRGVPTPCTREEFYPAVIPPHPDISHPDGRGGRFNFSGQTYPDPLIALTRRVFLSVYSAAVLSWSFLIFLTDILRYFRPIFWDILL